MRLARVLRAFARLSPADAQRRVPDAPTGVGRDGFLQDGTRPASGGPSASDGAQTGSGDRDDIRRSLAFLGRPVERTTVIEAGYGAALVAALVAAPVVVLAPPRFRPAAALAVAAVALGAAHAVHRLPAVLAAARRALALGAAPGVVGRAVLRLRVTPTAESAAAFAAETGDDPLSASLADHVRHARGTPSSGLDEFADEWERWFPELGRAVTLLDAAATAQPGERSRALDRALETVLDGTRDRMASFAGAIREPATALYAFGVLLPLALIAVLPAARVAGVPVTTRALGVVYCLMLPGVVLVGAAWLLLRRPVAFPPPTVDRSHPGVDSGYVRPAGAALLCGAGGGFLAAAALGEWAGALAAVGGAVGAALVVRYRSIVRVRNRARAVESALPDALYLVGRAVSNGSAVETGIDRAAERLGGPTGQVLSDAAQRQRQLRIGVEAAFLGDHGALDDVPSSRARSTATLLALAAREGRPAGTAIVSMAGHLRELRSVEDEARRELERVTGTLRSTATIFGPLVAGVTVALSDRMGAMGGDAEAIATGVLGPMVGAYVLLLAAILTALAVGLERGLDRALVGHRVGGAVLAATCVYLAAFLAAGLVI